MARRRKLIKLLFGVLLGLAVRLLLAPKREEISCPSNGISETDSSANSSSDFLFVGVMTAEKFLKTRAKSAYETWGRNVPGKVVFFSSEISRSDDFPLVGLEGIDDSYPPQRKSFKMLKYMHDNYLDKFEWFLRADDDVYIKTDRLENLLRSVDSRKPWFIGQTGRGNSDEFGLLSLEENENFCMGGPGVILSRETLRRVAPNIQFCLENLFTSHEDVELGRCVKRFAGVSCTWSYEMQVILYHNQSGDAAFSGDLNQKEVHRAITMHPVKYPEYMGRLHDYVKGLQIQQHQQEMVQLHRDIHSSMLNIGISPGQLSQTEINEDFPLFPEPLGSPNYLGNPQLLGVPVKLNRFIPNSLRDVLEWELIAKSLYSHKDSNPRRRIGSSLKEGLTDSIREIMELINVYSKQRGRIIDFREILYGYWRVDPLHGVDLILDMSLTYKKYRGHKMTVPVRRHAYVQQSFLATEILEIVQPTEQQTLPFFGETFPLSRVIFPGKIRPKRKRINMIVPLSGRHETFGRFLATYVDVCVKQEENVKLMVVLFKDEINGDYAKTLKLVKRVRKTHPGTEINVTLISDTGKFSRGNALEIGAKFFSPEDLLLFIDVDITFNFDSLERIRLNTVQNRFVYFPIVFSLYQFGQNEGFWRQFGYGIVSLYKSDFVRLGGFNTSIVGWGLEDVNLFDSAIKSNLKIVRSVDKDLTHVFHPVECDVELDKTQSEMCLGTKANILGPLGVLQTFFKKHKRFLGNATIS